MMQINENYDPQSTYQIIVKGVLDESWSDWFDGFTITVFQETKLVGPIRDQASLHGLLAKIRDLGLELVSVEQMDKKKE
jgi:hypothetical protein